MAHVNDNNLLRALFHIFLILKTYKKYLTLNMILFFIHTLYKVYSAVVKWGKKLLKK